MDKKSAISRVMRSKKQARTAYDRLSRWYDGLAGASERPFAVLGLKALRIRPGESVLEMGCGTGEALLDLASAVGESGKVYGIDLSGAMLTISRRKITRGNFLPRVVLGQADALHLPFRSHSIDAVFMTFVLELFDTPEIPQVLSECRRVLKPGRRIGIVALVRDEHENLPQRIYAWAHRRLPAYVDCRPIFLQTALLEAGFQVQSVTRKLMWGLPVEICVAE